MSRWSTALKRLAQAGPVLLLLALDTPGLGKEKPLVWHPQTQRLDAELNGSTLDQVLESLTAATGWQIFLEPGTERTVTSRFQDRPVGEALGLLLGNLNFALVPQDQAPSKLLVFRTSIEHATQRINRKAAPDAPTPIPDELILRLKPGADIDEIARLLGAKVIGRNDKLRLYRLKFENEEAAQKARQSLANNDQVDSVDSNYNIPRPPGVNPLALEDSRLLNLRPKAVGASDRVVVGLIDTAIQTQDRALDEFLLPALKVAGETGTLSTDTPTHATAMFETILRGISYSNKDQSGSPVRILPVDVYGRNESSSTYDVAIGIFQAINQGAMIINLSLGSPASTSYMEQVIQSGHEQGVIFFAAAGNEPVTTPTYPAAYSTVTAVTAGDRNGNVSSYANHGDFVDALAPGSALITFNNRSWYVAGTSAATAYATGLAAGLADSQKQYADIEQAVRKALSFR